MKKIGDYVVYKREVCTVDNIKEKFFNDEDYYMLSPINDNTLTINVPVSNKMGFLRDLITKDDVEEIISKIPNIPIIDSDEKLLENEYRKLMNGSFEDLIKIIKTAYLRNKKRLDNKKKTSEKDKEYLEEAEKYLYTEFSVVLDKNIDETREYVIEKVESLV